MNNLIADIPRPALVLGLGGLLPFFVTAVAVCAQGSLQQHQVTSSEFLERALGAYGAVILSFLGGIRWGRLLTDDSRIRLWSPLALSVVPSLVAWSALLLDSSGMLLLLIVGFTLQYALDNAAVRRKELPVWYGHLRLLLTGGALVSLSAALIASSLN